MDEIWCLQCSACQEHTFYGVCERDVYVEPPSELHRPGLVARLNKTMFGTQDASNGWKKLWREHLRSSGFELVASNPALYRPELQEKFDTRRIGMTGAAEHLDKELEVLHRSVRVISNELMDIEADQKHFPLITGRSWTHSKQHCQDSESEVECNRAEAIEDSPNINGQQAITFRSGTMRCAYLAQDRVDISESIKCLAQAMSKSKAGRMTQMKRVARYLKGVPRKAVQQPSQEPSRAHLEVLVDSDWAGDTASRRSRSAVIVRRGRHLLRHSSTVQNVIGLSGAESEYNALRRGAGKSTRHMQMRMLWLQERVAAKHLRVVKVATGSNPADMWTQRLVRQNLMRGRWTRTSRKSRSSRMSSLQLSDGNE